MNKSGGIYIHVPFCIRKCAYCDFYSITDTRLIKPFVDAVISEIKQTPDKPYNFDSIYFGGGTPSLLPPQYLDALINHLVKQFHFEASVEITLEANPKTIDLEALRAFKDAGINRLHLGVQSFLDPHLDFLGRIHSAGDAIHAIHMIREAGFSNMGIDLIYGLPGQTIAQWVDELTCAASYLPEHLSCYMLTYEMETRLDTDRKAGRFETLSDQKTAELFEATISTLSDNGYFQYEISNFTRIIRQSNSHTDNAFYRSRHNQKYWHFEPYLGFGPSAHSFEPPVRYWNVRNIRDYIKRINSGSSPIEDREVLTGDQHLMEVISLGLRTCDGVDIKAFEDEFGIAFGDMFSPVLAALTAENLLAISSDHIKPTVKGMLVLNKIIEMLVDII